MENVNVYFDFMQQQNLKNIRDILWQNGTMKVSDIAEKTDLSYPTVSKLLKELVERGVVVQCQELITSGGRPGVRYRIYQDYQQAVVMYFEDGKLKCFIYDYTMTEVFYDREYETDYDSRNNKGYIKYCYFMDFNFWKIGISCFVCNRGSSRNAFC